jgi:hypothetical protein
MCWKDFSRIAKWVTQISDRETDERAREEATYYQLGPSRKRLKTNKKRKRKAAAPARWP